MCLPWALLLVGAPGSCVGRWRRGLYGWAPVCSPLRSPVNTGSRKTFWTQAESLREPVSCLWCFSDLRQPPSTHTHTPLSAQNSTEDTDAHPSDSRWSTLAQSRALQGSFFPTASPSSGVTVSGPQVTTCPPTCSCPEGESSLKSHFPEHSDEGTWC